MSYNKIIYIIKNLPLSILSKAVGRIKFVKWSSFVDERKYESLNFNTKKNLKKPEKLIVGLLSLPGLQLETNIIIQ